MKLESDRTVVLDVELSEMVFSDGRIFGGHRGSI